MPDLSMRAAVRTDQPSRRLIAVGIIRRHGGRTTTVRATRDGVTGSITSGGAR
ncbi:hypothetical protein AB0M87_02565 [Streptomyces sp. NPDC051320]|uniref:hypothetical protein n=1 Tax=Streptomyces sp. NPDC051320 TaxID=3154644 RepID=UPI003432A2A8